MWNGIQDIHNLESGRKALHWTKPLPMDFPSNKDKYRRNIRQNAAADPEPNRSTKAEAAQDFTVKRSDGHELKQGGGLLS